MQRLVGSGGPHPEIKTSNPSNPARDAQQRQELELETLAVSRGDLHKTDPYYKEIYKMNSARKYLNK
jgi:hypothetical protein